MSENGVDLGLVSLFELNDRLRFEGREHSMFVWTSGEALNGQSEVVGGLRVGSGETSNRGEVAAAASGFNAALVLQHIYITQRS
jgi:hypothetical protein